MTGVPDASRVAPKMSWGAVAQSLVLRRMAMELIRWKRRVLNGPAKCLESRRVQIPSYAPADGATTDQLASFGSIRAERKGVEGVRSRIGGKTVGS